MPTSGYRLLQQEFIVLGLMVFMAFSVTSSNYIAGNASKNVIYAWMQMFVN